MLVSADYIKKWWWQKSGFLKSASVSSSHICLVYNSGKIWAVFSKANTSMEEEADAVLNLHIYFSIPGVFVTGSDLSVTVVQRGDQQLHSFIWRLFLLGTVTAVGLSLKTDLNSWLCGAFDFISVKSRKIVIYNGKIYKK